MLNPSLTIVVASCIGLAAQVSVAETLQDIYRLALQNEYQHKADKASFEAGKQSKVIGRANLLPQISASASYLDSTNQSVGQVNFDEPQSKFDVESETETYSVTLTQPVINMAAWFSYKQGVSLSEQAAAQFNADQQSLIIRTAEAYFNILSGIDALETLRVEEKAIEQQLDETQQRFKVGLGAVTGVHEAQAASDDANATTLQAQVDLSIAFDALRVFTGKSIDTVSPLVDSFPVVKPEPAARHDWVEFALRNNHRLQVEKLSAAAARQNARASTSAHLPTVSANYSYTERSDTNTDLFFPGSTISNDLRINEQKIVSLRLDVPIFSGMRISGERRQAVALHMQAQDMYNQARRDIIQEARSLHESVTVGVAQVKTRERAITSNESALEATQAGYKAGTRILVDVLAAQRSLSQAQRNYYDALYHYILNMLKLKEIAGTLAPEDISQLNSWLDTRKPVLRSKLLSEGGPSAQASAKPQLAVNKANAHQNATNTVPEVSAADGNGSEEDASPAAAATTTTDELAFTFTKDCWVEVYDANNKRLFAKIKKADDKLLLSGKSPFKVLVGSSREVALQFNGHPVEIEKIERSYSTLFKVERANNDAAGMPKVTTIRRK